MIDTVEELIPLPIGEVSLTRPRDAEALLSEEQFEQEEFLPYWAELWSSALALAHDVARRSLRGAHVLELGCGLGLPSIAAALAGGRVLATDWALDAVRATAANAALNGVALETAQAAWAAQRGPTAGAAAPPSRPQGPDPDRGPGPPAGGGVPGERPRRALAPAQHHE